MKRTARCMICYEAKTTGIFEYIHGAGLTEQISTCDAHKEHARRKAEQWQIEAESPKTKVTFRKVSKA